MNIKQRHKNFALNFLNCTIVYVLINKARFTWSPNVNISNTGVLSGKDNLDFPLVKKLVISSTS